MKRVLFLLDGLGYDQIIKHCPKFLSEFAYKKNFVPLNTLLGYSSGIYSSIWTGQYADQLKFWLEFIRREEKFPARFRFLRHVPGKYLPRQIMYLLTRVFNGFGNKTVEHYGIPPILFGEFERLQVDYHKLPPVNISEPQLITQAFEKANKKINYLFVEKICPKIHEQILDMLKDSDLLVVAVPETDHAGHVFGPLSIDYKVFLDDLDNRLSFLSSEILKTFPDISLNFFSDHGMTPVSHTFDLWGFLEDHHYKLGVDYVAFLNSTLASFWFEDGIKQEEIIASLKKSGVGHFLTFGERRKYHLEFSDSRYGDEIFVAEEGVEFTPNFISLMHRPNAGMHGYEPMHFSTRAFFLGDRQKSSGLNDVTDIYKLLAQDL